MTIPITIQRPILREQGLTHELPDELIENVLSLLPVHSQISSSCVCRRWNDVSHKIVIQQASRFLQPIIASLSSPNDTYLQNLARNIIPVEAIQSISLQKVRHGIRTAVSSLAQLVRHIKENTPLVIPIPSGASSYETNLISLWNSRVTGKGTPSAGSCLAVFATQDFASFLVTVPKLPPETAHLVLRNVWSVLISTNRVDEAISLLAELPSAQNSNEDALFQTLSRFLTMSGFADQAISLIDRGYWIYDTDLENVIINSLLQTNVESTLATIRTTRRIQDKALSMVVLFLLHSHKFEQAIEVAKQISSAWRRSSVLRTIGETALAQGAVSVAMAISELSQDVFSDYDRKFFLTSLIQSFIIQGKIEEATPVASKIPYQEKQTEYLSLIALRQWSKGLSDKAFETAKKLSDEEKKKSLLAILSKPPSSSLDMLKETVEVANSLSIDSSRDEYLIKQAKFLGDLEYFQEAFQLIEMMQNSCTTQKAIVQHCTCLMLSEKYEQVCKILADQKNSFLDYYIIPQLIQCFMLAGNSQKTLKILSSNAMSSRAIDMNPQIPEELLTANSTQSLLSFDSIPVCPQTRILISSLAQQKNISEAFSIVQLMSFALDDDASSLLKHIFPMCIGSIGPRKTIETIQNLPWMKSTKNIELLITVLFLRGHRQEAETFALTAKFSPSQDVVMQFLLFGRTEIALTLFKKMDQDLQGKTLPTLLDFLLDTQKISEATELVKSLPSGEGKAAAYNKLLVTAPCLTAEASQGYTNATQSDLQIVF
jgi:tetratricopeptide (TPR) repeat protein